MRCILSLLINILCIWSCLVEAGTKTKEQCLDIARNGMIADSLEQACNYSEDIKNKLKSYYAESECPAAVHQDDVDRIAGEVLPAIRNEFIQQGKPRFCKESKAYYLGLAEEVIKPLSSKKENSNSSQKEGAQANRKPSNLEEDYGIPSPLGIPSNFPKKFQECQALYQDADYRLKYFLRYGEYKAGRSIQSQEEGSTDKLMSFTSNSVQVQKNLTRWFEDCLKQAENTAR